VLARAVTEAGHEPACHGWRWRPHADFDNIVAERNSLRDCIDAVRVATGQRPFGFFCRGSESPWTRDLLAELGFIYTSNAFDDDVPYWHRDPPLLVVPYALDSNDMKFFHPNGFVEPEQMVRYVDAALSVLLDEADAGRTAILNLGFHLRICGRPARFLAVQAILRRLAELGDRIWVARRIDIARQWAAAFPVS
jgi:peptidoglycan/xylan/chitin deacetylase (PgdA/CDA1 family)